MGKKYTVNISVDYEIESNTEDQAMLEAQDRFQKDVNSRNILDKHLLNFEIHKN